MLSADRSLLEVNLRQSAIKLREKELNLHVSNIHSISNSAAILAGFTTTCLIELRYPENFRFSFLIASLHLSSIISICANLACVSLATITSIWGSGKALRGLDGSMDEAVETMAKEKTLVLKFFGLGLVTNMIAIFSSCFIIMTPPFSFISALVVAFTGYIIASNSLRITKKFALSESVRLDDLTGVPTSTIYRAFNNNKSETSKV